MQLLPCSGMCLALHTARAGCIPPLSLLPGLISLDMQGSIRTLLTALRSTVAIPPQVEEAMCMVPRSLFLPPGQAALAWQARPVLPSGHSIILGSPQAEALALQVRNVVAVWAYSSSTRQLHVHVLLTKRAKMLSMHDVLPGSIYAG